MTLGDIRMSELGTLCGYGNDRELAGAAGGRAAIAGIACSIAIIV